MANGIQRYASENFVSEKLLNDVSWNNLQDKPFGEEEGYVDVIKECTLEFSESNSATIADANRLADLVIGEEYIVYWNGVEYTATAIDIKTIASLGNANIWSSAQEDTGEPFLIRFNGTEVYVAEATTEQVQFKVVKKSEIINKIDLKFLPERECYEYTTLTELANVEGISHSENLADFEFIVGDTYLVTVDGVEYEEVCNSLNEYHSYIGNPSLINGTMEDNGLTWALFSKTNSFWTSVEGTHTVKVEKTVITLKQLNKKFLPEIVEEDLPLIQSSWKQNDPTARDFVKDKTHYISNVPAQIGLVENVTAATATEFDCDFYIGGTNTVKAIVKGSDKTVLYEGSFHKQTYTKSVTGVGVILGIQWFGNGSVIGNTSITSETYPHYVDSPVVIYHSSGEGIVDNVTSLYVKIDETLLSTTSDSYTVEIVDMDNTEESYIPLDDRFIPESIARVSDLKHTHSYNDLTDRTHYAYSEPKQLWNNDDGYGAISSHTTYESIFTDSDIENVYIKIYDRNKNILYDEDLAQTTLSTPNVGYSKFYGNFNLMSEAGAEIYNTPESVDDDCPLLLFSGDGNPSGWSFYMDESYLETKDSYGVYYVVISDLATIVTNYVQLDERFIPDTVARVSDFLKYKELIMVDDENGFDYIIRIRGGKLTSCCAASSIDITTQPTKVAYTVGETFDPTGMIVTVTCQDGSTYEITNYTYTTDALTADITSVAISYAENGQTYTSTVAITVTEATTE